MRVVFLFIFLASVLPSLIAQTTASQSTVPEVEIVKFSWSKERLNWQHNPFGGPNENFHEMQMRARAEKRLTDAKRGGTTAETKKTESDAKADLKIAEARRENENAAVPRYVFLYRTSIRNSSNKQIKEIDWDYVFYDAASREELGRRQFTSVQKIDPGKSKELSFMITTPPTRRISVNALDKKERNGIEEQVVVVRITYADGSVWQMQ
ncbi:MAG TPA: hypothetical protein VIG25_07175 [Pyrinomonadaceae bacterium]|jgi:hypothetical protein